MTEKIDLVQGYADHYQAGPEPTEVKLGVAHYLCFDGHGEPGSASFQNAIAALFAVAHEVKAAAKARGLDFLVPPCEALFFTEGARGEMLPRTEWRWRVLIRMPPGTTKSHVQDAKDRVGAKRGDLPMGHVSYDKLHEGHCVQALHVGPYDQVGATAEALMAYAAQNGWRVAGAYHEIYLSDPNRTAPDRLRTLVRFPVKKA